MGRKTFELNKRFGTDGHFIHGTLRRGPKKSDRSMSRGKREKPRLRRDEQMGGQGRRAIAGSRGKSDLIETRTGLWRDYVQRLALIPA